MCLYFLEGWNSQNEEFKSSSSNSGDLRASFWGRAQWQVPRGFSTLGLWIPKQFWYAAHCILKSRTLYTLVHFCKCVFLCTDSSSSCMTTKELQQYWRAEKQRLRPIKLLFEIPLARTIDQTLSKYVVRTLLYTQIHLPHKCNTNVFRDIAYKLKNVLTGQMNLYFTNDEWIVKHITTYHLIRWVPYTHILLLRKRKWGGEGEPKGNRRGEGRGKRNATHMWETGVPDGGDPLR